MWADSFLDGIVNSLQEQAKKPFLNKLEMNNADAAMVIAKLRSANYYPLYKKIYGEANNTDLAFEHLADAVATFEQSLQVNTSFGECPHPSRARAIAGELRQGSFFTRYLGRPPLLSSARVIAFASLNSKAECPVVFKKGFELMRLLQ
ncbi:cytochrome c peroxidase [Flavisolibacter nicotianae]|uniref:cytochrome c peroxidase n=1 Tax=Flavisolibacter nicotianae TaxID=2364882 RepID=UPI003743CE0F